MIRRGDVVTVAAPGDYGKPRPALVIQSDLFRDHPSVMLCLITSDWRDAPLFRIPILPSRTTGIAKPSQIMIDKVVTVPREKIGKTIGRADDPTMIAVNRAFAVFAGIA